MNGVEAELQQIQASGRLRSLPHVDRTLVDFSSNDYLAFSQNPVLREQLIAALLEGLPLGATGSRLLSGNLSVHEATEAFIGELFGEAALLFSSGYAANLGVMTALGGEGCQFFSDAANHASLIDGMRLARAARFVFRHNDLEHLQELLSAAPKSRRQIVVTESVFSMDGDLAPLEGLIRICENQGAWLVVDEAHATGVFGKRGLGRLEGLAEAAPRLIAIHTCGKALGAQGAFVTCGENVRKLLINRARSWIYSTALSPVLALQIRLALEMILRTPEAGAQLLANAEKFRQALASFAKVGKSGSHIVPVILTSADAALNLSSRMRELGFQIRPIRAPTVPVGTERLRIALRCDHSETQRAEVLQALRQGLSHG